MEKKYFECIRFGVVSLNEQCDSVWLANVQVVADGDNLKNNENGGGTEEH